MSKTLLIALPIVLVVFGIFIVVSQTKKTNPQQNSQQLALEDKPQEPSPFPTATITPQMNFITPTPRTVTATPARLVVAEKATITTSKGDIILELYPQSAPRTVANFVQKAQNGFYKNLTFHRVEDWVIQGGDPLGNGTGGGNIATELSKEPFVIGSLGVARGADIKISNDSQFFITKTDASWLNEQYTNFGKVTEGMDIVGKIQKNDKILNITVE